MVSQKRLLLNVGTLLVHCYGLQVLVPLVLVCCRAMYFALHVSLTVSLTICVIVRNIKQTRKEGVVYLPDVLPLEYENKTGFYGVDENS